MQLAIHDLARGADRQRKFIVCHLDHRAVDLRTVEFLEQQIDEAMIHASRRDIADSHDDLFKAISHGLLHEFVKLSETCRQITDAGSIQDDSDEIGRDIGMCQGNCLCEHHAHVDRADFAGPDVVKQDATARHAGYVNADVAIAHQAYRFPAVADPEKVAVPQVLPVEKPHVVQQSLTQTRRSLPVE